MRASSRSSRFEQIRFGIAGALVMALIVGFFAAPLQAVKWLGAPLLVLPSVLGITPAVGSGDVQTLSLYDPAPVVRVARPGRYVIFTDDRNVLSRANMLENTGTSWMRAQLTGTQAVTQVAIEGEPVLRGVRPYDPVSVPGRPILGFALPTAGDYVLSYPPQSGTVYFAPDTVTGREGTLVLAVAVQLIAIIAVVLMVRWPQLRRREQQRRQLAEKLAQKRIKDQAFWDEHERNSPAE